VIRELVHLNDIEGRYDDKGSINPTLNMLIVDNCFSGLRRGWKEAGGVVPVDVR
jgi:hypothetical protein